MEAASGSAFKWATALTSLQTVGLGGNPPGNVDVFELEL